MGNTVINITEGAKIGRRYIEDLQQRIDTATTHEALDAIAAAINSAPSSCSVWALARLDADLAHRRRAIGIPPHNPTGGRAA